MKEVGDLLDIYADIVINFGINLKEDENLRIQGPVAAIDFIRLLAEKAWKRGAKDVNVIFTDDDLTRLKYCYSKEENLIEVPDWEIKRQAYFAERRTAVISIIGSDPDNLKGLDQKKIASALKARNQAFKPFSKYTMNDIVSWCVIAYPGKKWAEKVFPDLSEERAYKALGELIIESMRLDREDPLKAWEDHIKDLEERASWLNSLKLDSMTYKSANGTDFTIGLPKGHIWMSAESKNEKGNSFIPNMPTEEVFTLPDRMRIEGRAVSSKPLSYNGSLIDGFYLDFKDGKVVDYYAEVGQENLQGLLNSDQNSKRLGEVALVPWDSPIRRTETLFYETLFDENAACHLALGKAYPTSLEGGVDMTEEELLKNGANDSLIHVDFMVGSEDLDIVGKTVKGRKVDIFKNGNWA